MVLILNQLAYKQSTSSRRETIPGKNETADGELQ
jgi:hypothetical protein